MSVLRSLVYPRWLVYLTLLSVIFGVVGLVLFFRGEPVYGGIQCLGVVASWVLSVRLARQREVVLAKLKNKEEEARRKAEELGRQAARLESQARELAGVRDKALSAVKAKDIFLASMSHELRTPLNAVIGLSDLLVETRLDEQQLEYVRTISKSSHTLLDLIGDILDMSKLEAGRMEAEARPFDLNLCVEDALDLVTTQAHSKGLALYLDVGAEVPGRIISDQSRLRQVLMNLLSNAVKFTAKGSVSLRIRAVNKGDVWEISFSVADTGIGMESNQIKQLFQPFYQADASIAREYGGTGLGLAISQGLVGLLGGRIQVESTPGSGSTFSFTIKAAVEPTERWEPFLGQRVLVVDADKVALETEVHLFESLGASVRGVGPDEALRAIEEEAPTMCLVDAASCAGEGASLLERIRKKLPRDARLLELACRLTQGEERSSKGIPRLPKPLGRASLARYLAQQAAPGVEPGPMEPGVMLEVLLVEDHPINRRVLLKMIEKLGHKAEAVAGGEEALALLKRRIFHVVLLDVNLPGIDGYQVAERIQAEFLPHQRPKIIGVTANALPGDRERCLAAGMDDYLPKPIELAALSNLLGAIKDRDMQWPTTKPSFSILDMERIRMARKEQGDHRVMSSISEFLKQGTEHFSSMVDCVKRGQFSEARELARLLIKSTSLLGAVQLESLLMGVDILLQNGRHEELGELLPELSRVFSRTAQALERLSFVRDADKTPLAG